MSNPAVRKGVMEDAILALNADFEAKKAKRESLTVKQGGEEKQVPLTRLEEQYYEEYFRLIHRLGDEIK